MFPYPSGAGLHVGHPEGYTATDIVARYKRMRGLQRAAPDGLGRVRPARRAATPSSTGVAPARSRPQRNIATFRRQIEALGFSYDWDREVDTTDPELLQVDAVDLPASCYERGLAYEARSPVNWCPALRHRARQRGGHRRQVRARRLPGRAQADAAVDAAHHRLRRPAARGPGRARLAGVDEGDAAQLDRPQRGRGGRLHDRRRRSRGRELARLHDPARHALRRDLHGAGARASAGRRSSRRRRSARRSTAYQRAGARARATASAPSWRRRRPASSPARTRSTRSTASRSRSGSPTTCWRATAPARSWPCPAHDERDFEFAKTFDLPIVAGRRAGGRQRRRAEPGVHRRRRRTSTRGSLDGLPTREAKTKIIAVARGDAASARARSTTSCATGCSRASATGASRSRSCTARRTASCRCPRRELPVRCPSSSDFKPTGTRRVAARGDRELGRTRPARSAAGRRSARPTRCRSGRARAGTTCATSIRRTTTRAFDPAKPRSYWMPVDLYVGGAEHAVLHLLYARFWHKVLFDLGACQHEGAVPEAAPPGDGARRFVRGRDGALPRARRGRAARRGGVPQGDGREAEGQRREDGEVEDERRQPRRRHPRLRRRRACACTSCSWASSSCPSRGIRARSRA